MLPVQKLVNNLRSEQSTTLQVADKLWADNLSTRKGYSNLSTSSCVEQVSGAIRQPILGILRHVRQKLAV
ncbi:hypothetical protein Y032_0091g2491 [Ancylostoma ceylanicum]|uniref:Uncharacterized protein n=1 Tax=Ancylostoma ceylanicum TaxID=53326 RepID=A0A016TLM7_9BILA|nr:hypothetical protein Y032_0091g2491 [Ancylostoma ceylanicum]